ncbi:MAG: DNA-3-methyladenine glycosylase I [Flavobacteriales bacterium]|nr:DNA-3-methyladenine glycosylase I [Flavobacteriales bacterium]
MVRCPWCGNDPDYIRYHDEEWGKEQHSDQALFELLLLEGFQAGLSWLTILRKRENFRQAFDQFNPEAIAAYDQSKIKGLMNNEGIVRNRLKIQSAIVNAQAFLKVQESFGSFDAYIWSFVGHTQQKNHFSSPSEVPARTAESDAMSRDLKKRGFKFCGTTICYAFMQASGMVNDHLTTCFRYGLPKA